MIDYIDIIETVSTNNKIKKRMFINGEWQYQLFNWSRSLENWLREKYLKQGYLKDWWMTSKRVTMNDKVYVHWKLCE